MFWVIILCFVQLAFPFHCVAFPLVLWDSWLRGYLPTYITFISRECSYFTGVQLCPFIIEGFQSRLCMNRPPLGSDPIWKIHFWTYLIKCMIPIYICLTYKRSCLSSQQTNFILVLELWSFYECFIKTIITTLNQRFYCIGPQSLDVDDQNIQ